MSQVKLSLNIMPIIEKLQFARTLSNNLQLYSVFDGPPVDPTDLSNAADALQAAYNVAQVARQDAVEKTTLMDNADSVVDTMLTQIGNFVQNVSNGDAAIIELSGISVRNAPSPIGDLPAPSHFAAIVGQPVGHVTLKWRRLRGANSYVAEHTTDPANGWTRAGASTRTRLLVTGLTSAARYWFRVAAVGAAGTGAWSDAIAKVAP